MKIPCSLNECLPHITNSFCLKYLFEFGSEGESRSSVKSANVDTFFSSQVDIYLGFSLLAGYLSGCELIVPGSLQQSDNW